MTLFTILRSTLFFCGDLTGNDEFTLSLLTNQEVLKIHAESSGLCLLVNGGEKKVITSRNDISDLTYFALFNVSDTSSLDLEVRLTELGSHASGLYMIKGAR